MSGIGLLNEKPLHASLKEWYAKPGDQFEVAIDGYVIDIVRDDLLLEIQTKNFASIKPKLINLLRNHAIRLIYPIPQEKWIIKFATNARDKTRRRSPKKGRFEDLFHEMVSFPSLLAHRNFSLEVLLITEEEIRRFDAKRNWRRRGWMTEERRLLSVKDQILFEDPKDWRALLPKEMETFSVKDLAELKGISIQLSQKMAYCLRKAAVTQLIGKQGRSNLYKVIEA